MNLEELKALCEKASPAPWIYEYDGMVSSSGITIFSCGEYCQPGKTDKAFLVAATTELPRLVELLERALPWLDRLQTEAPFSDWPEIEKLVKEIKEGE